MDDEKTPTFRHTSKRAPRQTANLVCDDEDYLEVPNPNPSRPGRKSEFKTHSKVKSEDPPSKEIIIQVSKAHLKKSKKPARVQIKEEIEEEEKTLEAEI